MPLQHLRNVATKMRRYRADTSSSQAIAARIDAQVNATFVETMMRRTICKISIGTAAEV
jgi:hypothetical protein